MVSLKSKNCRMKKVYWMLVGTLLFTLSCRKGSEDPIFSLISRKARISGEWKMVSFNRSQEYLIDSSVNSSLSSSGDENTIIEHVMYDSEEYQSTYEIMDYSLVINKDGTWSMKRKYRYETVMNSDYFSETSTGIDELENSGTWAFINKTKGEYKNKERVRFSILSSINQYGERTNFKDYTSTLYNDTTYNTNAYTSSNTFLDGEFTFAYDLIMLKSKEMKWQLVSENSGTNTYYESTPPPTNTHIYSSTETIIWKAQ